METDAAVSSIKEIITRINSIDEKRNDALLEVLIGQNAVNRRKRESIMKIFSSHKKSMLSAINGSPDSFIQSDNHHQSFVEILKSYESKVHHECEISSAISPPKSSHVLVRCLKDCGTIIVPSGLLSITKGSILYVAPDDVRNLIDMLAVEVLE